jgi:hypothetical protein
MSRLNYNVTSQGGDEMTHQAFSVLVVLLIGLGTATAQQLPTAGERTRVVWQLETGG